MKRYFVYSYFIIWIFISFLYYQSYENNKRQQQLIIDTDVIHDFEIAKEFFNSKLKNIYFQYFDDFVIKKTINEINNGNIESINLLRTLAYTNFYNHKDFLQNVVFYDPKGLEILSIEDINHQNIKIFELKNFIKRDHIGFEYFNKNNKYLVKINPLVFQGSIIGYIKQVVSLDIFMERFLSNYSYKILKSSDKNILDTNLISLEAINDKKYFILKLFKRENAAQDLLVNFYLNVIFSGIILFGLLALIYNNLEKEKKLKEKIKWQKEFFKKVINTSPNPIFVKDKNNKYLLANNAMGKLFDYDDPEFMFNKTNEELDIGQKIINSLNYDEDKALHTKQIVYKNVQKIGEEFYKFVHVPIYDLEYPINEEMVLGFATSITPEIQRKNELAKLNTQLKLDIFDEMTNRFKINEKFKKIFDNIHDAMFVCKIDKKGTLSNFVDINASGTIFLNRFKQYKEKNPNEIFDGFRFKYNGDKKRFDIKKYNYIMKIPNGKENINFQVSCNIIYINNDFHAVIFVQLIDEIIKLKREKREKQILIENIFKKAKSGIAVIDMNGKVIRFNKSFYETIGVSEGYFTKNSFFHIFDPHNKQQIQKEHEELFKDELDLSNEYKFIINDKIINIIGSSTIIEDSAGEKFRLFIFEDITKQKEFEKEQFQNSRIIAQQAKMAEMGEMIGAIAHQWRQPLNAINAAAIKLNFSASLDALEVNEVEEKTKFIEKQSLKMSETINDFMNFFKPSKSKEQFTLSLIYKKIFDFLDPQLKNRDISISLDNPDDIKIYGFQNEFEHTLLNLINNARDAFDDLEDEKEKNIKIVAYEEGSKNIIKIMDNAGGIPTNILNKVFNPYFTTKEQGKGTGIGLYMTKTIIDKHFNGLIEVTNSEDGAVFTLSFPKENND